MMMEESKRVDMPIWQVGLGWGIWEGTWRFWTWMRHVTGKHPARDLSFGLNLHLYYPSQYNRQLTKPPHTQ